MRANRGFSLLEIAISTSIFTMVVVMFFGILQQNVAAHSASSQKSDLVVQGTRAMERITAELRQTGNVKVGAKTFPAYFMSNSAGSAGGLFAGHAHAYVNPGARRGTNAYAAAPVAALPRAKMKTVDLPGIPATVTLVTAIPTRFQDTPVTGNATGSNGCREMIYVKPTFTQVSGWSQDQIPTFDAQGKTVWDGAAEYDIVVAQGQDGVLELQHRVIGGGAFLDGKTVHVLGRHCQWVYFEDSSVDATLKLDQVRCSLWFVSRGASATPNTTPEAFFISSVITMRNKG